MKKLLVAAMLAAFVSPAFAADAPKAEKAPAKTEKAPAKVEAKAAPAAPAKAAPAPAKAEKPAEKK